MRTSLLLLILLFPLLASAQTPTLVQHVSCSNGRAASLSQSSTPDYICPLPEPSQSGNTVIVGFISDNTGTPTFTVSDNTGSNTWTQACSATDSSGRIFKGYYASNVASGTRAVKVHRSSLVGDMAVSMSEYYNVGVLDASSCSAGSSSGTITGGSITPTVSGDLLWQWAANGAIASTTGFTAGSQSNITWQLLGTDIWDGDASQAGVYNSTSAISPSFTSGTAHAFDSVVMAFKAASAGNAPTSSFRIVHMLHESDTAGQTTFPIQFPTSGNLIIDAEQVNSITGTITSSPSNTWTSVGSGTNSFIWYAANATPSNSMTIAVPDSGQQGSTHMMYDIIGAATSPFDKDTGEKTGTQGSITNPLTICTGCMTPSTANEIVIGESQWAECTAIGANLPSGGLFDSATDTANSVDGPQTVDQNNGWLHFYNSNTNPLSMSWNLACDQANGFWSGRMAAFKAAGSGTQKPAPPTQLNAVVN
jgi:hypothetical protein